MVGEACNEGEESILMLEVSREMDLRSPGMMAWRCGVARRFALAGLLGFALVSIGVTGWEQLGGLSRGLDGAFMTWLGVMVLAFVPLTIGLLGLAMPILAAVRFRDRYFRVHRVDPPMFLMRGVWLLGLLEMALLHAWMLRLVLA